VQTKGIEGYSFMDKTEGKIKGKTKDSAEQKDFHFEEKLRELEKLVTRMEEGELGLEESLEAFEHGVGLVKQCQQALDRAEQKVRQLVSADGETQELAAGPAADQPPP